MRWLGLAVALAMVPGAGAHTMSEHGNVFAPVVSELAYQSDGLFLCEDTTLCPPLPSGLVYHTVHGVQGADTFRLQADDGQSGFGCSDEPYPPDDYDNGTPAEGTVLDRRVDQVVWATEDPVRLFDVLLCGEGPDFDVHFSGGPYANGWGDEQGTVPGDGDAVVTLFYGDMGEGFTYSES